MNKALSTGIQKFRKIKSIQHFSGIAHINRWMWYLRFWNALYSFSLLFSNPFLKYPITRIGAESSCRSLETNTSACFIEVSSPELPVDAFFTHSTSSASLNSSLNSATGSPSSNHLKVGKPSMENRSPMSFSVSASTLATRIEESNKVMVFAAEAKSARNPWRVK